MFFGPEALHGAQPASFTDNFFQAFFFSVQTSSTIGYGHITPGSTMANILGLKVQVHFSCLEEKEGKRKRNFYKLHLERDRVPFFPLSWTIVHPIDKDSPLYRMTHEDLIHNDAEFMLLLTGLDDTFNQSVYARSSYKPEEIIFGARFGNIYENLHGKGPITIDISRLDIIEKS